MVEFLRPKIKMESTGDNSAQFIMEPLERGFGYTLGNCMRRVLLSSLPGVAVTSIKVDNVDHEFTTIRGVKEDVTDVILNLKGLVLKMNGEPNATASISVKGPKEVKGSDVLCPAGVEVVNGDVHIATLNKTGKLNAELHVEKGRGYSSAERNKKSSDAIGTIPIDSIFTPISKISYTVDHTRHGERTDYDKLVIDLTTNGSLTPADAVSMAGQVINEHMELFAEQSFDDERESIFAAEEEEVETELNSPVEDLELSVRSYNCLKRQGIDTLEQLVECSEVDLMNIRNFGSKSIEEIKDKLNELTLSLKISR